ncbi:GNAT family N-acetyltransferase [Amphibacillus cookii]|uniref:GNAT family N-acetyltransferase n=1 Tax=Amphibacillus cookii TaxID=767787 RepID=UPI00195C1AA5|nr:GNAT family N-acetyltransferase [Amphibacillus cookii]MBM7539783.1 dTDP-4-amino-4,6-dideoxy-D-galactose acyltransferase [Amphibacillus cookii]
MKKMQWDSVFWGIDIFHLTKIETLEFDQVMDKNFLIQALPNVSDLTFIHELEDNNFKFQESKITFIKRNEELKIDFSQFKPLLASELKPYKEYFFQLYGGNSRFNVFSHKKVNEFYYQWLVNSSSGKMDDECIGFYVNGKLAAFVTYKINKNCIDIGLLGVFPDYRGQGISQSLLSYIDRLAVDSSIEYIRVSTQGRNTNAINAYIKYGFQIKSIDHWYYYIKGELK